MNKGMIILGILLIAGLSFACLFQYPWQSPVNKRYHCSYGMGQDNYATAAYMYAYGQPYVSWTSLYNLYGALSNMGYYHSQMCTGFEGYYAVDFRMHMLNYNGQSYTFNTIFNTILRTYFAHADAPGREYILAWLQETRDDYMFCVAPPQ